MHVRHAKWWLLWHEIVFCDARMIMLRGDPGHPWFGADTCAIAVLFVACGVVSLVAEAVAVRVLSQPAAAVARISVFDVSCGTPPTRLAAANRTAQSMPGGIRLTYAPVILPYVLSLF